MLSIALALEWSRMLCSVEMVSLMVEALTACFAAPSLLNRRWRWLAWLMTVVRESTVALRQGPTPPVATTMKLHGLPTVASR